MYWNTAAELGDRQSLYEAARCHARAAFFMEVGPCPPFGISMFESYVGATQVMEGR